MPNSHRISNSALSIGQYQFDQNFTKNDLSNVIPLFTQISVVNDMRQQVFKANFHFTLEFWGISSIIIFFQWFQDYSYAEYQTHGK